MQPNDKHTPEKLVFSGPAKASEPPALGQLKANVRRENPDMDFGFAAEFAKKQRPGLSKRNPGRVLQQAWLSSHFVFLVLF